MKRPLLFILGFYILGVLVGQYSVNKAVIVLFFMGIIAASGLLYKKYSWKGIVLFPIFSLLGFVLIIINTSARNETVQQFAVNNETVNISGKIINMGYTANGRPKVIIKTHTLETKALVVKQPLKIQVILDEGSKVEYNQEISISGELECFDFKRNPGAFDERLYMKTKKIDYKMFAKLIMAGQIKKPSYIYRLHERLNDVYDAVLPQKEASTLKLMLLGDNKTLDPSIKELYQKSGISHILAISGSHISLLAVILFLMLKQVGLDNRINSVIVLAVLIFYCILTGNNVSAVRAVVMIGIVLFGNILYRNADAYTSIAASALVLLMNQPLYLFDGGFQLSFSAVIGIIILTPLFCRIYFIPDKIRSYIAATVAATMATYPIVAFHFYTVSIIGLLVNILILPFASLLVGFGLLVGIIGLVSIEAAKFTCGIVYCILKLYEIICIIANKLPFATAVVGQPNIIVIIIYYTMLLLMTYYFYARYEQRRKIKKIVSITQISLFVTALIIIVKPKTLEIVYLDVGQGDAIAIHTADNKNMLIDGGGNIRTAVAQPNTGSRVLLPYFNYKAIRYIDTVFVTHPDGDHILGIIELIGLINIKQIVVSNVCNMADNVLYLSLRDKANKYSIPLVEMGRQDKINLKDIKMECLYPNQDMSIEQENWNLSSLVLYMKYKHNTFLFTGDIEKQAEIDMINNGGNLNADVLKLAHHGSKTSSSEEFVNRTVPSYGIISSGENNAYGHPDKEVVERYKKKNTKLYNTAYEGAIIVRCNGKNITIFTMKEREKR
jgi:competence protein ComEC